MAHDRQELALGLIGRFGRLPGHQLGPSGSDAGPDAVGERTDFVGAVAERHLRGHRSVVQHRGRRGEFSQRSEDPALQEEDDRKAGHAEHRRGRHALPDH